MAWSGRESLHKPVSCFSTARGIGTFAYCFLYCKSSLLRNDHTTNERLFLVICHCLLYTYVQTRSSIFFSAIVTVISGNIEGYCYCWYYCEHYQYFDHFNGYSVIFIIVGLPTRRHKKQRNLLTGVILFNITLSLIYVININIIIDALSLIIVIFNHHWYYNCSLNTI